MQPLLNSLPTQIKNVLVIGASGGIATAAIRILLDSDSVDSVTAVSRSPITTNADKLTNLQVSQYSEASITEVCSQLPSGQLDLVICTLGVLHSNDGDNSLFPEKRIEDITALNLQQYFEVNSIIPALWLKHLPAKMRKSDSNMVFLSARVGSIGDNHLGGWYGYRASKAALNMLVKTAQVEYQRRCPGCELILYHPGTVDTPLSKPFQRNVKPEKLFTPDFTAKQLFDILSNKPNTPPPYYLDWQKQLVQW